jgi:SagB-type dehydrogenase family enzyme
MNGSDSAQVVIVVSARFDRVMTKYGTGGYALILKDVGVLMATMYLVATAMELAPCALGGGDGELFARMIGSSFDEETSVGEFMLGRRRPPSGAAIDVSPDAAR